MSSFSKLVNSVQNTFSMKTTIIILVTAAVTINTASSQSLKPHLAQVCFDPIWRKFVFAASMFLPQAFPTK